MQALILVHAEVHSLTVKDVFRTAYMYAIGKDMPSRSLDEDVQAFNRTGNAPPYVIRYFLEKVGGEHSH